MTHSPDNGKAAMEGARTFATHPLFIALTAVLALGCQITPTFTTGYTFPEARLRATPVVGSLAVRRFEEERAPRQYGVQGRIFLLYIPLIPYTSIPFERLEESVRIQSDAIEAAGSGMTTGAHQNVAPPFEEYYYPNSFAETVAGDLAATGIFEAVEYVGDAAADAHRYVLNGTLRETPLRQSTTSFGLGMVGVLLWLLPVPMSKTSAGVVLDLELTDQEAGQVVWQGRVQSEISRLITLYTSSAMVYGRGGAFSFNLIPPPGDSEVDRHSLFSWHFESLRRGMLEARGHLAEAVQNRP